jgi:Tol biopolymer transport system component
VCNKVGKKVFQQITNNKGNNVSPCYLPDNNIVFCSDFETGFGRPQIYYLDRVKNKTTRLTSGNGYCAAPSYCAATHSIIYTRLINKTFQLFAIDIRQLGKQKIFDERQLTFCSGDKTEPQWDTTGRYAVFLYEFKNSKGIKESQIAIYNANSDAIKIVTHTLQAKSFPAWTDRILYEG